MTAWQIIALAGWLATLAMCLMARSDRKANEAALQWLRKRWYEVEQENHRLRGQNIFYQGVVSKLSRIRNQKHN